MISVARSLSVRRGTVFPRARSTLYGYSNFGIRTQLDSTEERFLEFLLGYLCQRGGFTARGEKSRLETTIPTVRGGIRY